ncbi:MAG: twin-arginine translocase TatA/TatE family subunit [Sphingobacteriaceae bacterium]|nr:MAG: twin-arginine translocase TatA/TatE family subunit [Sphingobacteriaceae bacterium]
MGLGTPEIILIVLAILLLFGGKKIPELMRGLGKGVKEFKDASNKPEDDISTVHTDKKTEANS